MGFDSGQVAPSFTHRDWTSYVRRVAEEGRSNNDSRGGSLFRGRRLSLGE